MTKIYTRIDGVCSFQIDVPYKHYSSCDYFIPKEMYIWLKSHGMEKYGYSGQRSSGDGYTNGITNKENIYTVKNCTREDGLAFQLQFPFTRVHIFEQFEYVRR